jgi:hypothetical protein
MEVPLILTLALEQNAFQFFNALRKIYYPAQENKTEAHLTLFRLIPHEPSLIRNVAQAAQGQNCIKLLVKEPVLTTTGVAYAIESPELVQLHQKFQQSWEPLLIPQDKEELWAHITIQSGVSPDEAQELLQFLVSNFCAFEILATGLQLWESKGGNWRLFREFPFIQD